VEGRLYILDVTTDDFLMRWIDGQVRQREREHVKFYSSQEYQTMFATAQLKHLNSKLVSYPVKVHIAVKSSPQKSSPYPTPQLERSKTPGFSTEAGGRVVKTSD
jgi:hypothetical protein